MFLKAIFSVVRPAPMALQALANLSASLSWNPDLQLQVFDKTGSPGFRREMERILAMAPPERIRLESRDLSESYTATLRTVQAGPDDRVVLVHDDDAWMGRIGGSPEARRAPSAVLPTIITFGTAPLIAWAPEGGALATSPEMSTRLRSLRFDMRQFTPYPFLFGALEAKAWEAFTGFLKDSPLHLPTWDRVMSLSALAQGPCALATDWTYFYDYGKWNAPTAHGEYVKGLERLGLEGLAPLGSLLLRTLYGLDQITLLDRMDEGLSPSDSQAIFQWILFDTIGYFRRKLRSGEGLNPALEAQWEAVRGIRAKGPNALVDLMLGECFPEGPADLGPMILDPLTRMAPPALAAQLAFWKRGLDRLARRYEARNLRPGCRWEA